MTRPKISNVSKSERAIKLGIWIGILGAGLCIGLGIILGSVGYQTPRQGADRFCGVRPRILRVALKSEAPPDGSPRIFFVATPLGEDLGSAEALDSP